VFRPFKLSDKSCLLRQFNDWQVARWLSGIPHPFTDEECLRWLDGLWTRDARGWGLNRVFTNDAGGLVGGVSLDLRSHELGFWVLREHWGYGLGTSMVSRFLKEHTRGLSLEYVIAAVHEENERSIRLVRRCGFEWVGTFPYYFTNRQERSTALFFKKTLA